MRVCLFDWLSYFAGLDIRLVKDQQTLEPSALPEPRLVKDQQMPGPEPSALPEPQVALVGAEDDAKKIEEQLAKEAPEKQQLAKDAVEMQELAEDAAEKTAEEKADAVAAEQQLPAHGQPSEVRLSASALASLPGGAAQGAKSPSLGKASTVAELVLCRKGDHRKALLKYIASFGDGAANFGNNPPCRSYRSLILLTDYGEIPGKLKKCHSAAEIAAVSKQYTIFKQALRDLVGMCKAAIARLDNSAKTALSASSNKKRAALDAKATPPLKKMKRDPASSPTPGASLFEFAHVECKPIPSIRLGEDCAPASLAIFSEPVIFRVRPQGELTKPGSHIANCADAFASRFQQDIARVDPGRAQRRCSSEAAQDIRKLVGLIRPEALANDALKQIQLETTPAAFAVAKQRVTCSAEPGHLASIRLGFAGTRQVVLAPMELVIDHIRSADHSVSVTCPRAYDWLKSATLDALKAFEAFASPRKMLAQGSVGPGDILYTPLGWFFYEQVGSSDYVGIRCAVLVPDVLTPLDSLNRYFQCIEKPNEILARARDALALS